MFVVLADALILPFQLAFKNEKQDGFDEFWFWWTTILFGLDIIANFNTAIQVDDDGSRPDALIRDRTGARLGAPARGWFGIDFFSTVPWPRLVSIFAGSEEGGGSTQAAKLLKVVKFLRLMRLMRMLRMAKLRKLWERVEDEIGSVLLVQSMMLVRILVIVVAICHWSACIFWIVGSPESLITDLMPNEMYQEFAQVPHWTTIYRTHGPEQEVWRWVDRPTSESYIFCFYWTLGVMRTMPAEVTPVNLAERVFVLLFMFFALSAFAISVASLTQAYFKISERSRSFTDELFAVRMHMKKLKMDQQCRPIAFRVLKP
ncbi:eag [Symbiodinium natans]|uniref:Eag protein n=1 Tax=Symbiodinium natans TaxID=878477 RepID=A0A812TTZ7_9DINO|nr:eag [Symbiodinium natans]